MKNLIDPLDVAGVYRIEHKDENRDKGYYIGVTKRKINEIIKEHQGDVQHCNNKTGSE